MIYLEDGSVKPVEKSELPVELPEDVDLNSKGNPLRKSSFLEKYNLIKKVQEKKLLEKQILWILLLILLGIFRFCSPNHELLLSIMML